MSVLVVMLSLLLMVLLLSSCMLLLSVVLAMLQISVHCRCAQSLWMLFVVEQGVDDARYVVAVDVSLFVLLSRWCHVGVVGSDFGVVVVVIFTLLLLLVLRLTLRVLVLPFAFLQ